MWTVEAAIERILSELQPLPTEVVPLADGLGRVLAADVVARLDQPPFDNSAMDGWAVRHTELLAGGTLKVGETIPAGHLPSRALAAGEAARIFTGARVPEGADTIVMQEGTEKSSDGANVRVHHHGPLGDHLRRRGDDFRKGAVMLSGGTVLSPIHLGLLAGQGLASVAVRRKPIVAILATGDEVHAPGDTLPEGHIYSSNGPMLAAMATMAGATVRDLGIARDDRADIEHRLRAAAGADIILTIGGVSVGDFDFVKDVLASLGGVEDFWKVAMRPGKPNAFGRVLGASYFGLPGNPVSCAVSFGLFVLPALQALSGRPTRGLRSSVGQAAETLSGGKKLRHYLRVRVVEEAGVLRVWSAGSQMSAHLRPLAVADAVAVVPESVDRIEAGAEVELRWLPQPV